MPNDYCSIDIESGDQGRSLRLVLLDTKKLKSEQYAWLDKEIKASKFPRIVLGHHHVFSHGKRGDTDNRPALAARFAAQGVKNYISGHEHDMQYVTYNDINYFLVGGGGAVPRKGDPNAPKQSNKVYFTANNGIGIFEVDLMTREMQVVYEIYDASGRKIDTPEWSTQV